MSTGPETGLWVELTCDGNRRFESDELAEQGVTIDPAKLNADQAYQCYKLGGDATKKIIETARDEMLGLIALWVWSTKNWERPKAQADAVFRVTEEFLTDLKDDWMHRPENADVRLVHMGRTERLREEQPHVMQLMEEIMEMTRQRTGMIVALLMDYSGPDEDERARQLWKESGCDGEFTDHLDLPRHGVPYRELDLRIRTGETSKMMHVNAVMRPYEGMETRDSFHTELLPEYTPALFQADLAALRSTEKRKGK